MLLAVIIRPVASKLVVRTERVRAASSLAERSMRLQLQVAMSRRQAVALAVVVAAALVLAPQPALGGGTAVAATDNVAVALPGCTSHCGNMSIPHPFGVEPWCHLPGFNVTCRNGTLFLGDGTVEVLEISIPNNTVRINADFAYFPGSDSSSNTLGDKPIASGTWSGALGKGWFASLVSNRLFVLGCNVQVFLVGDRYYANDRRRSRGTLSTCATFCDWDDEYQWFPFNNADPGMPHCEAAIMMDHNSYEFKALRLSNQATAGGGGGGPNPSNKTTAALAWILDSDISSTDDVFTQLWIRRRSNSSSTIFAPRLPAVLEWTINHTTCYANESSAACRSSHSYCRNDTESFIYINECVAPKTYPCYGICNNTEGSYQCLCPPGYVGNASVPDGCTDINECAHPNSYSCHGICTNMPGTFRCQCKRGSIGDPFRKGGCQSVLVWLGVGGCMIFLLLALSVPFIARKIKQHKAIRTKERFFKQNHGLLLQQLISQKSDIGGRMIITLGELEKATNNFDPSHKVGGGGHGIVYKGLLDLQVVAIKKSKIIVQKEIDDFINEVVILSQINHRNIVKLIGCCLETEVPLLVYEFISNGTLAHHLHVEGNISVPWDHRMRIALEISKALTYLHSTASTQVLHRDIKSSNILLDDNLIAKVSDFGASRYISIDQTGVTTTVQGTFGYLDPMYYYTSRLTDKSDVFSFGVLLIELLTRKRPTVLTGDGVSLASHFASLIAKGGLAGIIDPQIMEEAEGEKIKEVANLATMCTKLNGEDRPTMREVEMTLENLRITKHTRHNIAKERYEKDQIVAPYISIEGLTMEASRQYTMEEEMLLSGTYPR